MWASSEIALALTALLSLIIACAAKFQRLIQDYTFGSGLVAGESFKEITPAMTECPSSPSLLRRSSSRLVNGVKEVKSKLGRKLFRSSNNLNLKMTPLSEALPEKLTDDVRKELQSMNIGGIDFSGKWVVNRERSGCLDKHLEAVGVPWIARVVAKNSAYTSEIEHRGLWWQEKTTTSVVSTTQEMRLDGGTQSEPHPMDRSECICETRLITKPSLEASFSVTFSSHCLSENVANYSKKDTESLSSDNDKVLTTSSNNTSDTNTVLVPESSDVLLNDNTGDTTQHELTSSSQSLVSAPLLSSTSFDDDDVGFAFIDGDGEEDLIDVSTVSSLTGLTSCDASKTSPPSGLSQQLSTSNSSETTGWRPLPDNLKPPSPSEDKDSSIIEQNDDQTSLVSTEENISSQTKEEAQYPRVVTRTFFKRNGMNQVVSRWLENNGTNYVVKNDIFLPNSDTILTALIYFDLVGTVASKYKNKSD